MNPAETATPATPSPAVADSDKALKTESSKPSFRAQLHQRVVELEKHERVVRQQLNDANELAANLARRHANTCGALAEARGLAADYDKSSEAEQPQQTEQV